MKKKQPNSLQAKYAKTFQVAFIDAFSEAEENNQTSFYISKKDFDEFLIRYGLIENMYRVPEPNSGDSWSAFVQKRNSVRAQLNDAASLGAHGHPPYRIDVSKLRKSDLEVQLLTGMALVTFTDAANAIKSLAQSKISHLESMTAFFKEHQDELPPEIRFSLDHQADTWDMIATNVASQLNNYVKHAEATYKNAQAAIKHNKYAKLEHQI